MMHPELHSYHLARKVTAFSTTRRGGYSSGHYGEFNINPYCGDTPSAVTRNREALCHLLGISDDHLILPHQTHETRVVCIDEDFLKQGAEERRQVLEGVDALMTNLSGVCIGVSTADCIPVLLYDEEHDAICAVHAGWRGTRSRIVQKAVEAMAATFGTRPHDLTAQIGPGISLDSFEVGDEVWEAFREAGFDMRAISRRYPSADCGQKWHIDLPVCNRLQLTEAGLAPHCISMVNVCTYKQSADYFSARRLGVSSGRIFTGIMQR